MHLENAAGMWASKVAEPVRGRGYLLAEHDTGARVVILDDTADAAEVMGLAPRRRLVVEDAFGVLEGFGGAEPGMPIMVRRLGGADAASSAARRPGGADAATPAVRVEQVQDPETLAVAERVIVDGFPLPAYQPWEPGRALPAEVLKRPGWKVWIGWYDGEPAAAAYTFDDGTAVGVYWLATLPGQRSRGAGRAVLTTALATAPERHFTLIATEAGRPLYESAGFEIAGDSVWHTRPPLES
ncbi:hypothetical protein ACTI_71200 [Actinoplanes sp. OR16]|nr:hypothetical protein ACTI_71200 [Actinoplanes sp. OR16]